ncbi:hypothetical protein IVB11_04615 [Bradyrhizobium sp. 177]|nr:hypothetical protein [Bradyrhizobium sp. 177]
MASASAMDPPSVNGAAMETSGAHAPSTSAIATTTATSAAGIGIIGNERGREKNDGRNKSQKITKHGMSSLDMGAVIRFRRRLAERGWHPNMALSCGRFPDLRA